MSTGNAAEIIDVIRRKAGKIIDEERAKYSSLEPGGHENDPTPRFNRKELADRIEATEDFEELTGPIARDVAESGLPETSILSLRKFIAKKAKVSVASLEKDAKKEDFHLVRADKDFLHLDAAREVVSVFGEGNLIDTPQGTWRWNGCGVWKIIDNREIKQKIHKVADSKELTRSIVDSILDLVKTEVFRPNHEFDPHHRAINIQNGELHWNGAQWELKPHCREHYRTTQLPGSYDPRAKAPRFEKFLDEVFENDPDKDDKKVLVCEMVGYSLLSSCEYEKFFVLIGSGANGKSVLMETIGEFVGRRNVSAVQPSQFENRFQRAHLHGKLVNLVTEIAEGHEIADAQLKAIVSGELTTAEHKHKPPFDFRPFCTCIFGTNHMPHTRDFSDALFRRAIILTFNRKFEEHEQDKYLKEKLKAELPGILNLALNAMACVFQRGEFTKAASCEAAKAEWRTRCDQVAQFVQDVCRTGPGLKDLSSQLFSRYSTWANAMGIKKTLNHNNFTSRLKRLGFEPVKGTGGIRLIAGIELKG